jgi:hypothetical protein
VPSMEFMYLPTLSSNISHAIVTDMERSPRTVLPHATLTCSSYS